MNNLLFSSILVAGAAALATPGASYAQASGADLFDPEVSIVRVGSSATSFLGVNLREIDPERAKELKLKDETGVEITRVEDDSPAAKAGLKIGDVVLSYNGTRVEGMEQFSRFVRETPPGREVKLLISRDGHTQTLAARIGAHKSSLWFGTPGMQGIPPIEFPSIQPMPDLPRSVMMWRTPMLGIEAEALHGQMADYFGVTEGVLVRSVMKDTPAAKAGLKAGDVIVKIGDSTVGSPNEVTSAVHSMRDRKSFPVVIVRDHKEMTLTATVDQDRSGGEWNTPAPRHIGGSSVKM